MSPASAGRGKRICIITPGHVSTNPRVVKEADALAEAGYSVSVIAANFTPWARTADLSFGTRSWRRAQTLTFGPLSPLPSRIFQGIRQRAAKAVVAVGVCNASTALAAAHPIGPDLIRAALDVPADLYIAHYTAALPAAAIAARRHEARYAFDAEDFHLGDLPDERKYEAQRRIIRAIETRYLPGCAYVTAAAPGIAGLYADAYRMDPPTVLLNVFPLDEAPSRPTSRGAAEPGPSVYWFSQTIGPRRGLECAVRAIGLARSAPHLYLRGRPAAGYSATLHEIAAECGVADRVHILPPAPPSDMARLASVYDLGLSGEDECTRNRRVALTNKLFTYLLAGLPIVMSETPGQSQIASEFGEAARLYPSDDPMTLAARLDEMLLHPDALASARTASWRLGQARFNWDNEQAKLLDCVAAVLEARTGTASGTRKAIWPEPAGAS